MIPIRNISDRKKDGVKKYEIGRKKFHENAVAAACGPKLDTVTERDELTKIYLVQIFVRQ